MISLKKNQENISSYELELLRCLIKREIELNKERTEIIAKLSINSEYIEKNAWKLEDYDPKFINQLRNELKQ